MVTTRPFIWIVLAALAFPISNLRGQDSVAVETTPIDGAVSLEMDAAIRRLIEVTNSPQLILAAMEAAIPGQREALPDVPDVFWEEMVRRARGRIDDYVDLLVPVYAGLVTLEEVEGMITFYQSPLGQRMIEVQPILLQESTVLAQRWGGQLGEEIAQDLARKGIIIR